ncbi:hypothetical protein ADL27_49335, partial [Streptomyces sp. NRRL F-6602]
DKKERKADRNVRAGGVAIDPDTGKVLAMYGGIDARDLNTAQGAYLASLLNAPSAYDVIAQPANRSRAEARWNYVLDGMVKENWLTASGRARLSFPTPDEQHLPRGLSGQRGY